MKSRFRPRRTRAYVLIATTITAVAAGALAGAGVSPAAAQTSPAPLNLRITPHRVTFGHAVAVSGTAPSAAAGQSVVLEASSGRAGRWRALARTRAGSRGAFRFRVVPRRSATIRVLVGPTATGLAPAVVRSGQQPPSLGAPTTASLPERLTVAARFALARRRFSVLAGRRLSVSGALLPAAADRRVALQGHTGRGWRTLSRSRTRARGRFRLRYVPRAGTDRRLRVRFAGDRRNARTTRAAGRVTVFARSIASWYEDGGQTACGFHAGLGVANRTLPCGTKVTFRHAGRTVTATVDDRGPYVGGRDWDLNQATAAALGFAGVGPVWVNR